MEKRNSFFSSIFSVFIIATAINAISSFGIFIVMRQDAQLAQKYAQNTMTLNKIFDELERLERTAGDLNAPGNDIFESKDLRLERARFESFSYQFKKEFEIFLNLVIESPLDKDKQAIIDRCHVVERFAAVFSGITEQIFVSYEKKMLEEASKNMAQMDRGYAEFRASIIELRGALQLIAKSNGDNIFNVTQAQGNRTLIFFLFNGVLGIVLVAIGVFAARRSQAEKRVSDFYKFAIDQSAIVTGTDKRGVITFVNDKFSQISGYRKEEIIGKDHRIINSKFHPKEFFEYLWQTIGAGKVWQGEVRNRSKTGEYYWVDSTVVPQIDSMGAITGFTSIRFDITKRKEFEALIEMRQKELDQFFDLSQDFLCIADRDGNFKKVNHAFENNLGFTAFDLNKETFYTLIHPDDLEMTKGEIDNLISLKQGVFFTNRVRSILGDYFYVTWMAALSEAGSLYLIGRDDTEQITMNKKLENAMRAKSSFLANMSHEIRTPLHGILGLIELLSQEKLSSSGFSHLTTMKSSGEVLLAIINDILDFSKIEAGKLNLERAPFNLEDTIDEVIKLLRFKIKEKGLSLFFDFDQKLPKMFIGDVTRFRQVLTNLVSNAVKFTQDGSVSIKASGQLNPDGSYLVNIDVIDTGLGISKEMQSQLFKSFSQVDASTTRKFGGTGLGLAICKGICEAMGGKIWVNSEVGKGSTFSFSFIGEMAVDRIESTKEPEVIISQDLAKNYPFKIMVADDHPTNQLLISGFLARLGYKPVLVSDGFEVLKALESQSFDAIFMDGHMPNLDGYEATAKIRKKYIKSDMPWIIAFTASASKEDQEKCYACGMNDFVAKPFSIETLAKAITRIQTTKSSSLKSAS